ncbi:MAG TPA: hypothetical protein VJ623_12685 [Holophagaceae bacterium]|nr:hypothetical protein [Holophagaceae bacterium]
MSWSDPSRRFEPAEDVQLRAEMSELLGFEPAPRGVVEPQPDLVVLAEELQKEALRRKRLERRRPSWGLLAAAVLPLAAAVAGLGVWAQGNRVKAEAAVAAAARKTQELEQKLQAHQTELAQERATREQMVKVLAQAGPKGRKLPNLVIEAAPVQPLGQEQVRVSAKPNP